MSECRQGGERVRRLRPEHCLGCRLRGCRCGLLLLAAGADPAAGGDSGMPYNYVWHVTAALHALPTPCPCAPMLAARQLASTPLLYATAQPRHRMQPIRPVLLRSVSILDAFWILPACRLVDEIVWVKMTVNRRLAKSHGFYLQHAKEVRGGGGSAVAQAAPTRATKTHTLPWPKLAGLRSGNPIRACFRPAGCALLTIHLGVPACNALLASCPQLLCDLPGCACRSAWWPARGRTPQACAAASALTSSTGGSRPARQGPLGSALSGFCGWLVEGVCRAEPDPMSRPPPPMCSERRGQSQKPEEIYQLIEQLVPNGES